MFEKGFAERRTNSPIGSWKSRFHMAFTRGCDAAARSWTGCWMSIITSVVGPIKAFQPRKSFMSFS